MGTFREEQEAELQRILNSKGGAQRIRELYEEITGKPTPGVTYINGLIPELLDRHVEDAEAALMVKDFLPAPDLILKMNAQEVGTRLLLYFEDLISTKKHRNAINRDYIGGRYPVQSYPTGIRHSISKVLLEGWDWLVNQGMIAQENKQVSFVLTRRGEEYLKREKEKQGRFMIFYSWQSDLPYSRSHGFIQECIEEAISIIATEGIQLVPALDRDTQGEPGAPDIAETILDKIDNCDMFICDVSIITEPRSTRPTPNPNVMLELGYAAKRLGWDRITNVFNSAYGKVEELPFDLRKRRVVKYLLQPEESKTAAKKSLVEAFGLQIKACVTMGKAPE